MQKELIATLITIDKTILNPKALQKAEKEFAKQPKKNIGVYACPVTKKLPWMQMEKFPDEFVQDVKNQKNPKNRYYLIKIKEWNPTD